MKLKINKILSICSFNHKLRLEYDRYTDNILAMSNNYRFKCCYSGNKYYSSYEELIFDLNNPIYNYKFCKELNKEMLT